MHIANFKSNSAFWIKWEAAGLCSNLEALWSETFNLNVFKLFIKSKEETATIQRSKTIIWFITYSSIFSRKFSLIRTTKDFSLSVSAGADWGCVDGNTSVLKGMSIKRCFKLSSNIFRVSKSHAFGLTKSKNEPKVDLESVLRLEDKRMRNSTPHRQRDEH